MALWTDEKANVVDAWVLGNIDFLFYFGHVLQGVQNSRVEVFHQFLIGSLHKLCEEVSGIPWSVDILIFH